MASQHHTAADNIFEDLKKFQTLIHQYPNSRLTFVEIPHYSIIKWNARTKSLSTDDYVNQDQDLHKQIVEINQKIQELNASLKVQSPLLNLHLIASKKVKRGKDKPRKQYINYQLYLDGIHLKPILAKAWLAEFSSQIRIDCWR